MAIQTRHYVVETLIDPQVGWQEVYETAELVDAERFWRGLIEVGTRAPARLLELEVMRSYPGEPSAAA